MVDLPIPLQLHSSCVVCLQARDSCLSLANGWCSFYICQHLAQVTLTRACGPRYKLQCPLGWSSAVLEHCRSTEFSGEPFWHGSHAKQANSPGHTPHRCHQCWHPPWQHRDSRLMFQRVGAHVAHAQAQRAGVWPRGPQTWIVDACSGSTVKFGCLEV